MSSSSSETSSSMQDFVPVWPRFGNDNQCTQRATASLDLDNLSLYFSNTFSDVIYSGNTSYGYAYDSATVPIVIATYDDEEYAYLGTGFYSGSNASKLIAIKTKLNEVTPIYSITDINLLTGTSGSNRIKSTIVTSSTGQRYILAYCPDRGGANYELFRINPTSSTVVPFTDSTFTDNGNFQAESVSRGNVISINGVCYYTGKYLTSFNPDNISATYLSRSSHDISTSDYFGTYMVTDPLAISGVNSIYIFSGSYGDLFRTDDITNPVLGRDTNTSQYWGGGCRGMLFKGATNPLDRRLYCTTKGYAIAGPAGIVSYDKDFLAIDSELQSDSTHVFSGPALGLDGTIYYRAGTKLYAIEDSGLYSTDENIPNGSLSVKYTYDLLPDDVDADGQRSTATPVIDGSGRIVVCSNSLAAGDNVHILRDTGSALVCDKSFRINDRIQTTPSIGSTGLLYILAGGGTPTLYVYGTSMVPPPPSSSSSSFDFFTKDISTSFINQGHHDIIPFTWIAESGTQANIGDESKIGFQIEAIDASNLNYKPVIDRDNVAINATPPADTATVYVPKNEGVEFTHEKSLYVDIIAKDINGIREVRTHVEPNKYEFKKVEDLEKTFLIPKFTWEN